MVLPSFRLGLAKVSMVLARLSMVLGRFSIVSARFYGLARCLKVLGGFPMVFEQVFYGLS